MFDMGGYITNVNFIRVIIFNTYLVLKLLCE